MLTEERQGLILDELRTKSVVSVTELVDKLGASESTIRRDLNALDDLGKLRKIHGGASAITHEYIAREASVADKAKMNVEAKQVIGRYAAGMIQDDDFVFIDAGTSTEWLIEYIGDSKATFVTNGIAHAKKLTLKNLRTYMIGGMLKPVTEAVVGAEAVNSMKKYNFTKCFLGTNGIHLDFGFTTADVDESMVKMEAINRSFARIILADSSKFDKVSPVTFAGIEKACVITDRLVNDKYIDSTIIKEVLKL